jgi:hypothetical protein
MNTQNTDPKFLERWAAMYTLVMSIPNDSRFNMNYWGEKKSTNECGTTACMAGHAILHPWFIVRGFSLDSNNLYDTRFDLRHKDSSFWGINDMLDGPFSPEYCTQELDLEYNGAEDYSDRDFDEEPITPAEAGKVVKDWMSEHWGAGATEAAIAVSTVTYSVDHVHQNAPWHQGRKP